MFGCVRITKVFLSIICLLVLCSSAAFSANSAPTLGTATPATGNIQVGQWTTITCTYSDLNGAADLWRCSLLINNTLANSGGAHLIYSHKNRIFMMKRNAGTETNAVAAGTAATIETENAFLDCKATTVTASGNTITIAWRFKVKPTMNGKSCNLYMMAYDLASVTAPWTSKGTAFINTAPSFGTPTPNSGSIAGGVWNTMTCVYSDPNGADDLYTCDLLINDALANLGGARFMYDRKANKLYLKNNAGTLVGGIAPGTTAGIQSENVSLDCKNTTVNKSGNNLTIAWKYSTKASMSAKNCNIYLQAADNHGGVLAWVKKGAVRVNSAPNAESVSPASGTIPSDVSYAFTAVYSDPDGAANIATCNLLINTSIANSGGAHFVYNESTGKLYMKNNAGTLVPTAGANVGQATTIESENAVLDCLNTTVSKVGNTLTIKWQVKFKSTMNDKVCSEYMTVADDLGATMPWTSRGSITIDSATAAQYVAAGKSVLNSLVTMEPYDAAQAAVLLNRAFGYFQKAKNLEANNAQANFGLALTDSALTAQSLINKYQSLLDGGQSLAYLKTTVNALQFMNVKSMVAPGKEPLGGIVSSYTDSAAQLASTPGSADVLAMQADIRDVVRPMLSRVGNYLSSVETYGGSSFAFGIGPNTWPDYKIVDMGDVYLFHGALMAARWALAIPVSYNADFGTFDWDISPIVLDLNHDGILTTSEYIPADPFLALTSSATMTGAKADMITAADKIIAGIDATLAETSDNYELIPWHTPGEGPTQSELLAAKSYATSLKASMNAATTVAWNAKDGTHSMRVFLGAWNTNPPATLKTFCPDQEIVRWRQDWAKQYTYDMTNTDNGFHDSTFGGMFPDGLDLNEDRGVTQNTGYSGSLAAITSSYPANGATGVGTELWQFWLGFTSDPPATVNIQLKRYFAGAWRSVQIYFEYTDELAGKAYFGVEGSLWPDSNYKIVVTDVNTMQSIEKTFRTGADAPF